MLYSVLSAIVCLFVLVKVVFRLTASDYPLGIFKLIVHNSRHCIVTKKVCINRGTILVTKTFIEDILFFIHQNLSSGSSILKSRLLTDESTSSIFISCKFSGMIFNIKKYPWSNKQYNITTNYKRTCFLKTTPTLSSTLPYDLGHEWKKTEVWLNKTSYLLVHRQFLYCRCFKFNLP